MKCTNWTAHAPIAMQRSTIYRENGRIFSGIWGFSTGKNKLEKNVVSLVLKSVFLKSHILIFPNYLFQAGIKNYFSISFLHLRNVEKICQSLLKNVDLEKYTSFPYKLGADFVLSHFVRVSRLSAFVSHPEHPAWPT